jgi:guanine deaminase
MSADTSFMGEAIALSFTAMRSGKGGPYGAVVVKDGQVIGRGMNEVTSRNDPTHHAEMAAIWEACQTLNNWKLEDCELYTSCEPCPMCMAAAYWARIKRVYYGNTAATAAAYDFNSQAIYAELAKPHDQRQLPMEPMMQAEAIAAFDEWANKADKAPY